MVSYSGPFRARNERAIRSRTGHRLFAGTKGVGRPCGPSAIGKVIRPTCVSNSRNSNAARTTASKPRPLSGSRSNTRRSVFFDIFNASPPLVKLDRAYLHAGQKTLGILEEQIRLARSILFTIGDVLDLVAKTSRIVLLEEALLRAPCGQRIRLTGRSAVQGSITSAIVRQ